MPGASIVHLIADESSDEDNNNSMSRSPRNPSSSFHEAAVVHNDDNHVQESRRAAVPHGKKRQALSPAKMWAEGQDRAQQRRRRAQQSVCFDVTGPSPLDLNFYRGIPLPPPPLITAVPKQNSSDNSNNDHHHHDSDSTPWHWQSMLSKEENDKERSVIHPPPRSDLVLVLGIKRPFRPVIRLYEYVEHATPDVLDYTYERNQRETRQRANNRITRHTTNNNKGDSMPPRHVLLASWPGLLEEDSSPTSYSPNTVIGELGTDAGESRPWLPQSIPRDPDEFILNDLEIELAWLGEESWHCLGTSHQQQVQTVDQDQDTHPFQWDYIWHYSSPALRIELRRVDHLQDGIVTTTTRIPSIRESQEPNNRSPDNNDNNCNGTINDNDDTTSKLKRLVRWDDPLVRARFRVVREWVRQQLNRGYRRNVMKRVMAQFRLIHRRSQVQQAFPEPDWHLVHEDVEFWKNHLPALNGTHKKRTLIHKSHRTSNGRLSNS